MSSHVVTLPCAADTYIGYNSGNLGGQQSLRAGAYYGSTYNNKRYASILGFDLSSIPANKTITRAVLNIRVNSIGVYYRTNDGGAVYSYEEADIVSKFPFILKTTPVLGYNLSEIETNLSYASAIAKTMSPYVDPSRATDYLKSAWGTQGTTISFDIPLIKYDDAGAIVSGRPTDNALIIQLKDATNYSGSYGVYDASFGSRESANPPTLTVYYDDYVPVAPSNLYPNATVRNKNGAVKLAWQFSDGGTGATQNAAEVSYSTDSFSTSTTKLVSGSQNYYEIPANTFLTGQTAQWKARITDTNGDISAYSDIASFNIGATLPSAPELISPVDTIVNSSDIIVFQWKFVDNYGYSQGGFDFTYAKEGEAETVVHVNSAVTQYAMPKNTLLGGNYKWRVKTYNEFGESGAYSAYKGIYSIGKPNAPIITNVTNDCRPIVTWNATEQDLFVIRLLQGATEIYNSGEQIGGLENKFKIPKFLSNGSYTLAIKTSNVYGFWSNETTYIFTVNTSPPVAPSFVVSVLDNAATLVINSTTASNIIYRKGKYDAAYVEVTELTKNSFTDYQLVYGENQYMVRSISENSFSDSEIKTVNLEFEGIILSNENDLSMMINLNSTLDNDKRKNVSITRDSYKINCVGRIYPISQKTEFRNYSEAHEYFLKEAEYLVFETMLYDSNIAFYRNSNGVSFYAEVTNVSAQENTFGYTVTFTLTRLDRS